MNYEEQDDRRVTSRSNDECRRIAQDTKAYYSIGRTWPVYVGRVLRRGKVPTLRGEKPLLYQVADEIHGIYDARTEVLDGSVVVTVKRAIDSLATWGEGRAQLTLAHELGHAIMHAALDTVDHRAVGASGMTTMSRLNAAESAEHQAKVFASAFLIDDVRASELTSPLAISTEFLVSLSAAEICYERLQLQRDRTAASARVSQVNDAFQALMRTNNKTKNYLQAVCTGCNSQTLLPLGIKVGCETCGFVGNHPEDN